MNINIITLLIFGPLLFYPFSYCPFRLPYLYCFICPARCVWYRLRGIVLILAVGLNIKNELFCNRICPLGTAQTLLYKISPRKITLPGFLGNFKYLSLVLLALVIAASKMPATQIFPPKLKNLILGIFLLSMVLSIFSHRIFCYNLCPIKALSKILYRRK